MEPQVQAPPPPRQNPGLDKLNDALSAQFDELEKTGQLPLKDPAPDPKDEPKVTDEVSADKEDDQPDGDTGDDLEIPEIDTTEDSKLIDEFATPGDDADASDDGDDDDEPDGVKHTRADDEDSKEDLEEIKNNPHTPEKTRRSINRLLGKNQSLNKTIRERDAAIKELQEKVKALELQEPKADGMSDEERHELNMLRRRHQIDNDKEIKDKFDSKLAIYAEELDRVVSDNLDAATAEQIKKIGFENFAKQYPKSYKEFIENLEDVSPLDADMVKANLGEMRALRMQRDRKVKELVAEADEYFKAQSETIEQQKAARQEQLERIAKLRQDTFNNITLKDENFVLLDTKGLSGDQLKLAEAENARRKTYHQQLEKIINAKTEQDQINTVYRAALVPVLADRLKAANKTIQKLQSTLKAIKSKQSVKKPAASQTQQPRQSIPNSLSDALNETLGTSGGSISIPH